MAARGQSLLPIAAKVTKNARPCTPLLPPVLATGGMRRTAHESFAGATHSVCRRRIYDRPLLRSSARAEGAIELIFDRFAMRNARLNEVARAMFAEYVYLTISVIHECHDAALENTPNLATSLYS